MRLCVSAFETISMTLDQITKANAELRNQSALEVVRWAIAQASGRAIVSTNFRPYEAVILHLVTQVQPDIPVLWVDHGYNRPATYKHAEQLKSQLKLNINAYLPGLTAAHYDAVHGVQQLVAQVVHRPVDESGAVVGRHDLHTGRVPVKTYKIAFERDQSGWWVASVRGLRGCHTQGRTVDEARRRIVEAME